MNKKTHTSGPLTGVNVLDLTQGIAGPYCTKLLAGLGANVIKVEAAPNGDSTRSLGPYVDEDAHLEKSIPFLYLNTGKRSSTLDLNSAEAPNLLRDLAATVDLLVEDLDPKTRKQLEVSYDHYRENCPSLVVASVTHFGLTGPYADYLGEEIVDQALSGHMAITGEPDREPLRIGGDLSQYVTGQTAFVGALMALYHSMITGEGQQVDCSALEASTDILDGEAILSLTQQPRVRWGNTTADSFLRGRGGLYETNDGWIALGQVPGGWDMFVEMIDDDRLRVPELADRATRIARKDEIESIVEPWLLARSKIDIHEESQRRRNVSGYVALPEDILSSRHLAEREYFVDLDHPVAGSAPYAGAPYRFLGRDWYSERAPLLGEHNRSIYVDHLGMSPAIYQQLLDSNVI
tara:strand:+ start:4785 stop:6002 length:1218 start_codon:yes stop_codon:yes gene_type:complete